MAGQTSLGRSDGRQHESAVNDFGDAILAGGVNKWGAGPSLVVLTIQEPWVFGVLVNNVWAGTSGRRVNQMLIQPFVNYNLPDGWYLTTSPVITANWQWFFNALGDSGGFGVGSKLTTRCIAAVGYNWTSSISTSVGYRALYTDYQQSNGGNGSFRWNTTLYGPFMAFNDNF